MMKTQQNCVRNKTFLLLLCHLWMKIRPTFYIRQNKSVSFWPRISIGYDVYSRCQDAGATFDVLVSSNLF